MRLGQTVTATLVSFMLLGSTSAQNLKETTATVSSRYRLEKGLPYNLHGLKILVLSAKSEGSVAKPRKFIWKELEDEGVELTFVKGNLSKYKLKSFDQLWVFSSNRYDARFLTNADFDSIVQFALAGKGLYLLSDAVTEDLIPHITPPGRRIGAGTFESDAIARELFGAKIHGCYRGQQVLQFTAPGPTHPLLAGVSALYEGTTVSHISGVEKLDVIVSASDGSPLIAVPKSQSLKVVLDFGYTRYHPKSSDDSVQLALNVARFLTGSVRRLQEPLTTQSP